MDSLWSRCGHYVIDLVLLPFILSYALAFLGRLCLAKSNNFAENTYNAMHTRNRANNFKEMHSNFFIPYLPSYRQLIL